VEAPESRNGIERILVYRWVGGDWSAGYWQQELFFSASGKWSHVAATWGTQVIAKLDHISKYTVHFSLLRRKLKSDNLVLDWTTRKINLSVDTKALCQVKSFP
jgi:hypothetical protein